MSIEIMLNAVNYFFVAFQPIIRMHKVKYCILFMAVAAAAEVAVISYSSFDL
jgi:NADH:ubiquinone oxidoreductase subunit K